AKFYTTNGLGLNEDDGREVNSLMFNPDGDSFSLLGQAYVSYKIANTQFKVGRQQIDTPLAGSDDIRMIPNLFEAYLLVNTDVKDTTLIAAHVTKMSGMPDSSANGSKFESMSDAAGLGGIVGNESVTAVAAIYAGIPNTTIQVWDYYANEMLNAIYADIVYENKATEDLTLTLAGQYYTYKEQGKVKDAGAKVNYNVMGAKIALASEKSGLTGTVAYNQVSDDPTSTPVFGAWGGYPEYAFAEEFWMYSMGAEMFDGSVVKAGLDFDLGTVGFADRTLSAAYVGFDGRTVDVDVYDVAYTCEAFKNLNMKVAYEYQEYSNDNENSLIKVVGKYSF
ncbi:MAG: outer membrane porin, OprD family, partial [Campylobacterales bacterium]|nr:outer membrane porin, OprD family [Campylobacterales bacterium]